MNIRPNQPVFQVIGITLIVTISSLAFGEVAEAVVSLSHKSFPTILFKILYKILLD